MVELLSDSLSKYTVFSDKNMIDAIRIINNNNKGFAIVLDDNFFVRGVVTDGDIRRALMRGKPLEEPVLNFCKRDFVSLTIDSSISVAGDEFKKNVIKFIPIVDDSGKLVNLITKNQMHTLLLKDIHTDLHYDFESLDEAAIDTEVYYRPWGFYKTTVLNDYYQAKVISVKPEGQLSLQLHRHREEHWVVVHGNGIVQLDDSSVAVHTGSSVFIPTGCKHRLTNTSQKESLILCEIQIGDYLGEDDIVRFEDKYGRV